MPLPLIFLWKHYLHTITQYFLRLHQFLIKMLLILSLNRNLTRCEFDRRFVRKHLFFVAIRINVLHKHVQYFIARNNSTSVDYTRSTIIKCGFQTTDGAPEQFVLCTIFCVSNKCQMRTSDKLEKCVYSVVLLCSICRNLYRTESIRGQH